MFALPAHAPTSCEPWQTWVTDVAVPALTTSTLLQGEARPAVGTSSITSTFRRVHVRSLYDAACFVIGTVSDFVAAGGSIASDATCASFLQSVCGLFAGKPYDAATTCTTPGGSGSSASVFAVACSSPPPHVQPAVLYTALRGDRTNELCTPDRAARFRNAAGSSWPVQAARLAFQVGCSTAASATTPAATGCVDRDTALRAAVTVLVTPQAQEMLPVSWTADEEAVEDCSGILASIVGSAIELAMKHGYMQVRLPWWRAVLHSFLFLWHFAL